MFAPERGRELELGNPALLDGRILFAPARGRELEFIFTLASCSSIYRPTRGVS